MNSINLAILDNDPLFLGLLKAYLSGHFTFYATTNTQEFEETVKQPAVILMDMFLDNETGLEVMRRIRPKQKLFHVIFISATASKEIIKQSHNEGWGGFFLEKDEDDFWEKLVKRIWEAKALLRDKAAAMIDHAVKEDLIAEQISKTLKSFE
jgi:CheY-like chemotaxis protein